MSAIEGRIRALPLWKSRIAIEPLRGGLSNESFLITESGGRHVVRIGRDFLSTMFFASARSWRRAARASRLRPGGALCRSRGSW